MSMAPQRAVVEVAGRADVSDAPRPVVWSTTIMAADKLLTERVGVLAWRAVRGSSEARGRWSAGAPILAWLVLDLGFGQVRGEHRELAANRRHCARPWRAAASAAVITPCARRHVPSTRLRARARGLGYAIGAAQLGRLRQRHEQGRFRQRQAARLLAEVGERCRAHALEVAAERREAQIKAQDLVLGELRSSCSARTIWRSLPPPVRSCLPSSRRATCIVSVEPPGDDAAVAHELPAARADGDGVDAAVAAEALVLEGEQHGEIARSTSLASTGSRQRRRAW